MIPEIGHFLVIVGLAFAFVLAVAPMLGIYKNNNALIALAKPAAIGQFAFFLVAFAILVYSFIVNDFSVKYVAANSNTQLPMIFKISATWGAHEGSLLLWALILAGWTFAVALFNGKLPPDMIARILAVLGVVSIGFTLFILITSNPFERLTNVPLEGRSLNPLLQDIGLAIHPPMLYMGYVGLAVAFAFAIAVLLKGEFQMAWARWAKIWTVIAWAFLTLGIALGSWWAYYELGWGGWWFWDPVENASLLPWIIATALIHTLSISASRGTFQSWTLLLAILAFSLSLLGTFLVRSGVLTSVHAFTSDPARGVFILIFLVVIVGVSLALYSARSHLVTQSKPFKLASKETLLLSNNVILVAMMATVLLGTLYPLILDALGLAKLSVGAPYFNTVMLPLTVPLALLMGFGFATKWMEDKPKRLLQKMWLPMVAALLVAFIAPLLLLPEFSGLAVLGLLMSAWIAFAALHWLLQKNPNGQIRPSMQTVGSVLAHIGFAVTLTGITITSLYSIEKDVRLEPGEKYAINQYEFEFKGVVQKEVANYLASQGTVIVYENGQELTRLYPEKRTYLSQTMPMTEAGIDAKLSRDLFIALGEKLNGNAWAVRIQYKPFVRWIWLGAILMSMGGVLALIRRKTHAPRVEEAKA
ncbi:c-type cytochrome biogenesis protein CcmF [Thiosulfatimonas sediminis]|uniref:C-type cytochrome biogenesis protein CcmF n=1 Tax=Thiosulfatimonas sediminis TaxID=2675054 RepID=A0A6F8PX08_9GAMM|nr:heme lyase CcmF/NrfE family subunit [Thiosulfatimonas sediminis]BBP46683.1 c-type cytochrome biogenesis protein CcmF [Thiosulfatimonas sediminis]